LRFNKDDILKSIPSSTTTSTNESNEEEGNSVKSIVCLICHECPEEYVILSACSTPHIYCMSCAERMKSQPTQDTSNYRYSYRRLNHPKTNTQTITCALCNAVTNLDPDRGLNALKRRTKKRKLNFKKGECETHNKPFLYYCLECLEPICLQCRNDSYHSQHRHDTLDEAFTKCRQELGTKITLLENKKKIN